MITGLNIRIMQEPWGAGLSFLIVNYRYDGRAVVDDLTLKDIPEGTIIEPTGYLEYKAGQQLMDDLWACGLRPSEGTGSAGQLAATQKHLNDMREIVFKKLNIKEAPK